MTIKMLCMGATALAMMGSAAMAASTSGTSALDDPAKMSPFFTDAGMKTMKSQKDFKTAWMAMKPDERTAMMKECADAAVKKAHAKFCAMAKKMGG
ncbi:hypothetical protein [Mesorhizobium sp. B2-3-5]|uniref:hypothetical protein n=1 Tax=Mesorhizobium sp. B2-3-5 TaxID=2589958 RepID=UPI001125DF43|nr:hypothetical protein [Mesorhizobium sp. B2-3-5]TPM19225.1 hypothetical protein FJ958_27470 [Mesorhizobium sp. B2-3-5]